MCENLMAVTEVDWGKRVNVTGKYSVYTYVILVSHIFVRSRDVQYFLHLKSSLLKK